MIDRPKFKEMTYDEYRYYNHRYHAEVDKHGYFDSVEMKMDGIWGCMVIKDGQYKMYSRTGKVKKEGAIKHTVDMILLGEYMKGSHWGHKMGLDGKFFAFDCLQYKKNLKIYSLTTRRKYIIRAINDIDSYNHPDETDDELLKNIVRLPHYPINQGWNLWYRNVKRKGYEGIVLKNSKAKWDDIGAWARIKDTVEIDYLCIGFEPADPESKYAGQVGAVKGSLVDHPCDVKCGGLTDEQRKLFTADPTRWIGQVFKATGHGWFPSGSVRHPKFSTFRSDKSIMECTYDQIPEMHRED